MPTPKFPHLLERIEEASRGLPGVSRKRMFGCDVLLAGGATYGMVWIEGRIGLKLPEPAAFNELMALPGSDPWTAWSKRATKWVLVPESFHDDPGRLRAWVERAHRLATGAPAKKPAARASAAKAKRPAKKAVRKAR